MAVVNNTHIFHVGFPSTLTAVPHIFLYLRIYFTEFLFNKRPRSDAIRVGKLRRAVATFLHARRVRRTQVLPRGLAPSRSRRDVEHSQLPLTRRAAFIKPPPAAVDEMLLTFYIPVILNKW